MAEDGKRSTLITVVFLVLVLFIYYFSDIMSLMFKRYYSPYWSLNTVSAIAQMYAEAPCVSKVRFDKCDGGKRGIDAVCYMRWDAGIKEDLQAYSTLCDIVSSENFLSMYLEDVFSEQDYSDIDQIVFSVSIIHKGQTQLSGDAFYEIVVLEDSLNLVQTCPFPLCPPIKLGY